MDTGSGCGTETWSYYTVDTGSVYHVYGTEMSSGFRVDTVSGKVVETESEIRGGV